VANFSVGVLGHLESFTRYPSLSDFDYIRNRLDNIQRRQLLM